MSSKENEEKDVEELKVESTESNEAKEDKEKTLESEEKANEVKKEESQETTEEEKKTEENNETPKDTNDSSEKKEEPKIINESNSEEKPEYVVKMIKRRKRIAITIFLVTIIIILAIAFSTVFALLNSNSQKIIQGIYIKNIDVSGLTVEEATKKVNDAINIELQESVSMKYNDYTAEIEPNNIEYRYNVSEVVKEAYKMGREGNLVQNNYKLLFSSIFHNNLELTENYNDELLNAAITDISSKLPGIVENPSFYIEEEENKLIVVKGKDGLDVNKEKLKTDIIKNIKNRKAQDILNGKKSDTVDIAVENKKAKDIDIDDIYSKVHKEPVNAHYDEEPFKLYAQVDGIDFDISLDEAKAMLAEDKTEYEIPLKIIPAEITLYNIGLEAFPYEISTFSTRYDVTNVNRSINLKLAADKIDGVVLMPGEVFSYNQVVGKRTIEAGYKNAAIYVNGGVEDGLGGGICQISSTLYNAVLLANLGIVERENHTFVTSYVKPGRDATVVYGSIDFKFENTRNYPIKFETSVENGVATISIHGISEETEYEVRILPVITATTPFNVEYIEDPSLPEGQEVITQYGSTGYKVTTYKEVLLNDVTISKEILSNDTYSAMKRIVKIGTAE